VSALRELCYYKGNRRDFNDYRRGSGGPPEVTGEASLEA
jgi:hypothetical protein